ncbi:hypothetical protein [Streptomyces sp. NPDC059759]|uniref:hypothetical protein n=1 Tax=Streptomyces sp. NPDC059759 TaxID=3346936 RepID=UPI00366453B5
MGYPLYREVKKWAPPTLTHREKLAAMVLADDANDVTRETFSSVVDPDILRFAMVKNDRDMRKILTRLVEEDVLERVVVGGNGRAAKYRFRYLAPAAPTTVAGPNQTDNGTAAPDVAGPERTANSGVGGPNETANSGDGQGAGGPERTGYSGVAGPNRNSCRSESDLPTPSSSSSRSSTTSMPGEPATDTDAADGTLFAEPAPSAPPVEKAPPRRTSASSSEPTHPDAFDAFWQAYPRRTAKRDAVRAWNKAITDGTSPDQILQATRAYAIERHGEPPKFTKHPATWLNKGCYDDEPLPARHQPHSNPAPEDRDQYDEAL